MFNSRMAAVISIVLCLPLMFMLTSATLDYEPPFVDQVMTEPDGYTPTVLGRIIMLAMLLSLPAAFVVNLVPMFKRSSSAQAAPFQMTPAHVIVGGAILLVIMSVLARQIFHELDPFVSPLGAASVLGQGLCLLGLLSLPAAMLLNRLPRFTRSGSAGTLTFQPTSVNLIIGAAVLLVIVVIAGALALETTACAIGVPNCD